MASGLSPYRWTVYLLYCLCGAAINASEGENFHRESREIFVARDINRPCAQVRDLDLSIKMVYHLKGDTIYCVRAEQLSLYVQITIFKLPINRLRQHLLVCAHTQLVARDKISRLLRSKRLVCACMQRVARDKKDRSSLAIKMAVLWWP